MDGGFVGFCLFDSSCVRVRAFGVCLVFLLLFLAAVVAVVAVVAVMCFGVLAAFSGPSVLDEMLSTTGLNPLQHRHRPAYFCLRVWLEPLHLWSRVKCFVRVSASNQKPHKSMRLELVPCCCFAVVVCCFFCALFFFFFFFFFKMKLADISLLSSVCVFAD